jgi:hypothetical protein
MHIYLSGTASLDIKQVIKYIVWLAAQNGIHMNWVRIVKCLYLLDLYHARLNKGKTLTGWPWAFVHFGPYCRESHAAIREAEAEGLIAKLTYESRFEGRDEFDLFVCKDDQEPPVGDTLHIYIVAELTKNIRERGDDTHSLLDHVYFETEPMQDALPNQLLDFTKVRMPESSCGPTLGKIPKDKLEKGRGIVEKLKRRHKEAVLSSVRSQLYIPTDRQKISRYPTPAKLPRQSKLRKRIRFFG